MDWTDGIEWLREAGTFLLPPHPDQLWAHTHFCPVATGGLFSHE